MYINDKCVIYSNKYKYMYIYIYIHVYIYIYMHACIYIYIYLLQSRCNNNVRYFSKLLKTHFFAMQIFRSHFGSFFYIYITLHLPLGRNFKIMS